MLSLNDKNIHQNPLEISDEDNRFEISVAVSLSFNIVVEDEDDDIELDIM